MRICPATLLSFQVTKSGPDYYTYTRITGSILSGIQNEGTIIYTKVQKGTRIHVSYIYMIQTYVHVFFSAAQIPLVGCSM